MAAPGRLPTKGATLPLITLTEGCSLRLLAEKDTLKAAVEAYPVKDGTEAVLAMIEDVQAKRKR